jgi:putative photosynthetic complex assembly protein
MRGTLRGLARDRRMRDLGPEAPFRLVSWTDGRLTLDDTATGRRLDLLAFGQTQAEAFARLLPTGER